MARVVGRTVAALLGAVLVAGVTACGSSDEDGNSGPTSAAEASGAVSAPPSEVSPSTTSIAPTYRLVKPLCDAADIGPFSDAYRPDGNKPLRNSEKSCITGMLTKGPNRVVMALSLQAHTARNEEVARLTYEVDRRNWRFGTPTDLAGVGTRAYWVTNGQDVEIVGYHGNLSLTMTFGTVNADNKLPPGIPERMAKAMNGTFRNLAS